MQNHPCRKSPRATFHNYSGGCYFVTICTADKRHYFGSVQNSKMKYTEVGLYADAQISQLNRHYPYCTPVIWVIMPNHIHIIVEITDNNTPCERMALSVVIGGLKRSITLYAKRNDIEFAWQTRYHDHIIRGNHDGKLIEEYITNNVSKWSDDCFYS